MPLRTFHPLIHEWFAARFGEPTQPQRMGWPLIAAGRNTLIAAPTGSGKTLAAFLVCLNRLGQEWLEGTLSDGVCVVYVSPLKALSNDIERNLQQPQSARQKMLRVPPHILATTPESLHLVLTSEKSREVSRTVDSPKPGLSPLQNVCGVNAWAVEQASNYIEPQVAAIGLVPTTEQIVFERFFDESGGMQLVIHSPFGARINRSSWLQSDRKPRRAPELTSRLPSRSLRQT